MLVLLFIIFSFVIDNIWLDSLLVIDVRMFVFRIIRIWVGVFLEVLLRGMVVLDSKVLGKMGMWVVVYYMIIIIIVVVIGIIIVIIIYFGKGIKENMYREGKIVWVIVVDVFLDLIRNMFFLNLVEVCFK